MVATGVAMASLVPLMKVVEKEFVIGNGFSSRKIDRNARKQKIRLLVIEGWCLCFRNVLTVRAFDLYTSYDEYFTHRGLPVCR